MKVGTIKNPIKELERIEKIEAILEGKHKSLVKQKEAISKGLTETPWRITEVTEKLEEARRKALRVPEIRSMLARYKLSIEDVAFIHFWRERLDGMDHHYHLEWGYPIRSRTLKDPHSNMWIVSERYLYGGPQDRVKIIYDESRNSTKCIYGFIANSPVKLGREKAA